MPPTFNSLLLAHALQQSVKTRSAAISWISLCHSGLLIASYFKQNEAPKNCSIEHRHCVVDLSCAFVNAKPLPNVSLARSALLRVLVCAPPGPCTFHEERSTSNSFLVGNNQITRTVTAPELPPEVLRIIAHKHCASAHALITTHSTQSKTVQGYFFGPVPLTLSFSTCSFPLYRYWATGLHHSQAKAAGARSWPLIMHDSR